MSLSVIIIKIPFLSSPLISLYYESVKGISCTKTDIFVSRDCFIDIPAKVR